jgi:hypothetical protein
MLTEVFVRDNTIPPKGIENLIRRLRPRIVVVDYNVFSNIEDVVKEIEKLSNREYINILIIDECGLTKCECYPETQSCSCGYAIVDDLMEQKCLDKYDIRVNTFVRATRIRPM